MSAPRVRLVNHPTIHGVFFDLYGTLLVYGNTAAAWADWLAFHARLEEIRSGWA